MGMLTFLEIFTQLKVCGSESFMCDFPPSDMVGCDVVDLATKVFMNTILLHSTITG